MPSLRLAFAISMVLASLHCIKCKVWCQGEYDMWLFFVFFNLIFSSSHINFASVEKIHRIVYIANTFNKLYVQSPAHVLVSLVKAVVGHGNSSVTFWYLRYLIMDLPGHG